MRFTIGPLCAIPLAISWCVFSQHATAASDPTMHACSVLTRAEVRKIMPWSDQMEGIFPKEEEDQFANGSGCEYPSVRVQIMSTSPDQWQRWVDTSKNASVERVAGVGEEAYIRDNKGMFAELYAKSGSYLISLQKSLKPGETTQASKAQLIALGQALVAKLRSSPTVQQAPRATQQGAQQGTTTVCASCGSSRDPFSDPWSDDDPPDLDEEASPSPSRSNTSALADLEGRIRDLENASYFEVVSPKTGNTIFRIGPGGARFFNEREEPVAAIGTTDEGGYFSARSASGADASIGTASGRAGVRIMEGRTSRIDLGTKQGPFGLRFPAGDGLLAGLGESRAGSGAVLVGTATDGATEGSIVVSEGRAVVSMTKPASRGGVVFAEAKIGGGLLDVATAGGLSAVKMGHNSQRYGIVLAGPALGFPYVPRSGLPGSYFMGCASGERPACLPEVASK
jgi:hypothetical protein